MNIDITKMKKEIFLLNSLIKKYEENIINYYGKMNIVFSEWNDKNGLKFSEHVINEKNSAFLLINNLKAISNLFDYLIKKYEQFGDALNIDFNRVDDISNNYEKYIDKLDSLIKKYENLDLTSFMDEKEQILAQKEKIINMKKKTITLKDNNLKAFDKINEIEKDINYKISKISIENISETNISDYI